MIAVLGTLPFIATLGILMVLGAAVLEESGGKIAAALKGNPVRQHSPFPLARTRVRLSPAARAAAGEWRAAA